MEEEFKVLINVSLDQVNKVIKLLKNKRFVKFNSLSYTLDAEISKHYLRSYQVNYETCDAFITNNSENIYLPTLRERGCKIRILR